MKKEHKVLCVYQFENGTEPVERYINQNYTQSNLACSFLVNKCVQVCVLDWCLMCIPEQMTLWANMSVHALTLSLPLESNKSTKKKFIQ